MTLEKWDLTPSQQQSWQPESATSILPLSPFVWMLFSPSEPNLCSITSLLAGVMSPLFCGCCPCSIWPSIRLSSHPSLTPYPHPFHWQGRFLLFQSSSPIKLWVEGEQAEFSGLATPLWGHWLGLMLFTPHICSPGPMKRDGHGIFYGTRNKGPSFIEQQERRGVSKCWVHHGSCQLFVY